MHPLGPLRARAQPAPGRSDAGRDPGSRLSADSRRGYPRSLVGGESQLQAQIRQIDAGVRRSPLVAPRVLGQQRLEALSALRRPRRVPRRQVPQRRNGVVEPGVPVLTSLLNLLEVCGILGFNLSAPALGAMYMHFERRYGVTIVPGGGELARLPAPTAGELLVKVEQRMALKNAEIALVVEQHAATISAFLSWNARHFTGRLPVPALTPRQWLAGQTA
jgi:hypothetical protein